MSKCVGFGDFEGKCDNDAGEVSEYWCKRCEELRIKHLDKQFEKMEAKK